MKKMMKNRKKRSRKRPLSSFRMFDSVASNRSKNKISTGMDVNIFTSEFTSQSYEGILSKYTNMMKGWQLRWFILNPKTGVLSYFINKSDRWKQPKGWTTLESAVISPSDDDNNTFTVNSVCGNNFKLRAQDAKDRQDWINRLRAVSQLHSATPHKCTSSEVVMSQQVDILKSFAFVKDHLLNAEKSRRLLADTIENLPNNGKLNYLDPELLKLKALSHAVVMSLNQCLLLLEKSQDFFCNKFEVFCHSLDN